MSLTAEQRERILEEEKSRLAEEQYREQVRQQLRTETSGVAQHPAPQYEPWAQAKTSAPAAQSHPGRTFLVVLGVAVALCVMLMLIGSAVHSLASNKEATEAITAVVSRRIRIIASPFTIPARSNTFFTFNVSQPTGATLSGTFDIYGGGHDIAVSLTDANNVPVINFGRMFGRGEISQRLPQGQYRLVFNNGFSLLTPKSVTPDLALEF
jgi:hypothetical protein